VRQSFYENFGTLTQLTVSLFAHAEITVDFRSSFRAANATEIPPQNLGSADAVNARRQQPGQDGERTHTVWRWIFEPLWTQKMALQTQFDFDLQL
jgi:hypothetical protein